MPSNKGLQLSNKLTIKDIELKDKRGPRPVLYTIGGFPYVGFRVDYNVPLTADCQVANNQRIVATLPTVKLILEKGARSVVLMSHLGRPDGQVIPKLSLKPVAAELSKLLGKPVTFLGECIGAQVEERCAAAVNGEIILLENLRFHVEEEGAVKRKDGTKITATNDQLMAFRASLSKLGEVYVNDAFGAAHRAHSSITGVGITPKVAGLLISKELAYFGKILDSPNGIDLAILGGAKVSDKIQLIKNLLPKVRRLAIGGGMAFTFLKVLKGMEIGKSLFDEAGSKIVPEIVEEAKKAGVEIILPEDFITGSALSEEATLGSADNASGIPSDMMGLDFGPRSTVNLCSVIQNAKSVLWNGPVGVFEVSHFASGTRAVVEALVEATKTGCVTIVGGGDSGAAVAKWDAEDKLSHVSTGGGASLELLEGHVLPGIAALDVSPQN